MIIGRERAHYQPPTRPSLKFFDNCFPEMSAHPQFARVISLQAQNLSLLLNENTCILVIFKAKNFFN